MYAVFGPDAYLRGKCLSLLLDSLRKRGLELRRIEPEESLARVLDELRSPSLFGGALAVVVRNQRVGNRQEATTRFKEEWLGYLEAPSKRNVLVFDAPTFQRNLAVPKRVAADHPTVICEELKPWDVRGWNQLATEAAATIGLKLAPDALTALREYTGANLGRTESELHKLALLVRDGRVTTADVSHACGYEGADLTFPLCDAILTGDVRAALACAAKMAGKAELGSVLSLLALLRLQVVALGRASLALKQGVTASDALARSKARVRENQKAGFLEAARRLDRDAVSAALETLLAADESMKSASPDPANLLVGTVNRLCEALNCREPLGQSVR